MSTNPLESTLENEMNGIIPFRFEESSVRVIKGEDGEPWFVGKDVAEVLGYVNPTDAMNKHCKGVAKRYPLQTPGGMQEVRLLSEPDVLRLVIKSNLPAAERFERWVFEEVLPSIRKTGRYEIACGDEGPAVSGHASQLGTSATCFRRLYAAGRTVQLSRERAACAANDAVRRYTGIDVLGELRIEFGELTANDQMRALSGNSQTLSDKVRGWLDEAGLETCTLDEIITGLGMAVPEADSRSARTRLGAVMSALGWRRRERHAKPKVIWSRPPKGMYR